MCAAVAVAGCQLGAGGLPSAQVGRLTEKAMASVRVVMVMATLVCRIIRPSRSGSGRPWCSSPRLCQATTRANMSSMQRPGGRRVGGSDIWITVICKEDLRLAR